MQDQNRNQGRAGDRSRASMLVERETAEMRRRGSVWCGAVAGLASNAIMWNGGLKAEVTTDRRSARDRSSSGWPGRAFGEMISREAINERDGTCSCS